MAQSSEDIIKNIVLKIKTESEGAEAVGSQIRKITSSFKPANLGATGLSKNLGSLTKLAGPVGIVAGAVLGIGEAAYDAGKAVLKMMNESSKAFVDYAVATGGASQSITRLKNEYSAVQRNAELLGTTVTQSMKDVAQAVTKFANQGWAQFQIAGSEGGARFVAGLMNAFEKGTGSTEAAMSLMQNVTSALSEQGMGVIQQFKSDMAAAGNDLNKQAEVMRKYEPFNPQLISQATSAIKVAAQAADGLAPPEIMMATKWNELTKTLSSAIDNIKTAFLEAFGGDTTSMMDTVIGWIKSIGGNIDIVRDQFVVWKTVGMNGIKDIAFVLSGFVGIWNLLQATVGMSIKAVGMFTGLFDKSAGREIKRWGDDIIQSAKDMNKSFTDFATSEREDPMVALAKSHKKAAEAMRKAREEQTKGVSGPTDPNAVYNKIAANLLTITSTTKNWGAATQAVSGSLATLANLSGLIGESFTIAGQSFEELYKAQGKSLALMGRWEKEAAEGQIKTAQAGMKELESTIERLKYRKATTTSAQDLVSIDTEISLLMANMGKMEKEIADGTQKVLQYEQARAARVEQSTTKLREQGKLIDTYISQAENLKGIAEATAGAPGLGIEYIKIGNELLDKRKQNIIAQQKTMEEEIRRTYSGNEANLKIEQLRAEKQNELLSIQRKQIENLRELRDGYLNAVQAQAFGAGRFAKIIITQEQNMAKAMKDNMAVRNARLGAIGARALSSNVQSSRFSTTFGKMTNSQGQEIDNISQAKEALKNEYSDANRQMGQSVIDASVSARRAAESQLDGLKEFTKVIGKLSDSIEKGGLSQQSLQSNAVAGGKNANAVGVGVQRAASGQNSVGPIRGTSGVTSMMKDAGQKIVDVLINLGRSLEAELGESGRGIVPANYVMATPGQGE